MDTLKFAVFIFPYVVGVLYLAVCAAWVIRRAGRRIGTYLRYRRILRQIQHAAHNRTPATQTGMKADP